MPAATASDTMNWNFKLLSHNTLDGFGGIGEGMSIQIAKDGRRILWLAHESAPKNFTAVDISDPRKPKIVARADLPQAQCARIRWTWSATSWRSPTRRRSPGCSPPGFELFDISEPENPRSIGFFDRSGPVFARRAPTVVCRRRDDAHEFGRRRFQPRDPKDDQCYQSIDVRNPSKPAEIGRWWLPGTREGDNEAPPERHPVGHESGFRPHNTNVYPERPDRGYIGYIDGGMIILDIADKAQPKMVVALGLPPAQSGFTHTMLPLFSATCWWSATNAPRRRRRLAEAGVGGRQPQRDEPDADRDAADAAGRDVRQARRTLWRAQPLRKSAEADGWQSDHIIFGTCSTAACARAISPIHTSRRRSRILCPEAPRVAANACKSTTYSSTSAALSIRSTASPAGSTASRWISEALVR